MKSNKIEEFFNFKGKTAVVTGGSMGIGFAIVKRLAEAGANVVFADVSEIGETKAREVAQNFGVKTLFVKTDVSSEEDVKNLFGKVQSEFGSVDIMVNNAGIFPMANVLEMELSFWEKIQAINLRGVFLCCREAGKLMAQKGAGSIVNIASVDALHPSMVGLAAYDASKHGVWGFTKNFALEMAEKGVRVNAVAPGSIRTEGMEKMTDGQVKAAGDAEALMDDVPMKRMGEPDEMAMVVLFLASEAASYMTGSIVVADGGMLLK